MGHKYGTLWYVHLGIFLITVWYISVLLEIPSLLKMIYNSNIVVIMSTLIDTWIFWILNINQIFEKTKQIFL